MTPSDRQIEYLSQRVSGASPLELIGILYEAAVQSVEEALTALRGGDVLRRGRAVTKAIEILSELRLSLRREVHQEYCDTLGGLYSYLQRQLIRAHAQPSESSLEEVIRLLRTLSEGWTGAMARVNAPHESEARGDFAPSLKAPTGPYSVESPPKAPETRSWEL